MKIRKAICLLLVILTCFTFAGCHNNLQTDITPPPGYYDATPSPEPTSAPAEITPVLYKISDERGAFVWLFSSVDAVDSIYPLPEYVANAFDSSEYLAVEYDQVVFKNSTAGQQLALSHMLYQNEVKIKDCVSPFVYESAVKIMEENAVYSEEYDNYIAAFWGMLIDSFAKSQNQENQQPDVENYLTIAAKNANKKIKEMVLCDYHYQIMASFSDELQEVILEESIEAYNNPETEQEKKNKLLAAWSRGDIQELSKLSSEAMGEAWDKEICDEYIDKMYTQRNETIATWMESAIESGKEVFFCFDYTNVFAEDGIQDILTDMGYTVEVVSK